MKYGLCKECTADEGEGEHEQERSHGGNYIDIPCMVGQGVVECVSYDSLMDHHVGANVNKRLFSAN